MKSLASYLPAVLLSLLLALAIDLTINFDDYRAQWAQGFGQATPLLVHDGTDTSGTISAVIPAMVEEHSSVGS